MGRIGGNGKAPKEVDPATISKKELLEKRAKAVAMLMTGEHRGHIAKETGLSLAQIRHAARKMPLPDEDFVNLAKSLAADTMDMLSAQCEMLADPEYARSQPPDALAELVAVVTDRSDRIIAGLARALQSSGGGRPEALEPRQERPDVAEEVFG